QTELSEQTQSDLQPVTPTETQPVHETQPETQPEPQPVSTSQPATRTSRKPSYYTLDVQKLIQERGNYEKQPFPHQQEAFTALSKALPTPLKGYRGSLLVLPTGGGKTFTSINWICRNIINRGIKVLWLAQSSYLIDQAGDTFRAEIHNATSRDKINLRIVSSSSNHANSGSILTTDDVLICTTQTAISAYSAEQLDSQGNAVKTPFRKFVDNCIDSELFVVIDEAHHTPAYGCRTLLLSMRESHPNLYVLGLTATPMHMDKRVSGWLKNIYDQWICYRADQNLLQANKVLSVPKYIEKETGIEYEVDDSLYERLVNKHKDLPENIVDELAKNQSRNNFIVSDYLANKNEYGKTIIFADRWYQCEYIIEKLKKHGVKAEAVYSTVNMQNSSHLHGAGRRDDESNRNAMVDFRTGKLDVLVNVKMLTEGVDVPDVKTVMITRQTTSNILFTQMIGRALRGEKAGGGADKDYANIVFFFDSWKRLLPWANVEGEMSEDAPVKSSRNPMTLISTQLVKLAAEDIEYKGFENANFLTFIPVGFLGCEYTVAVSDDAGEELITFAENVIAYEFNSDKYLALMEALINEDLSIFAAENLSDGVVEEKAFELANKFFDYEKDNFDELLVSNITRIVRHIAQNGNKPSFMDFHERDLYDLDRIAEGMLKMPPEDADVCLINKYKDQGLLWSFLYKGYDRFQDAYYKSQKRALNKKRGVIVEPELHPNESKSEALTEDMRQQVFKKDNYTCLCCGKTKRKGIVLNVDHIQPVSMGGLNTISNLQTLCKYCNTVKGVNEVDYRIQTTPMGKPKESPCLFDKAQSDAPENAIARIVNEFYHCRAMCDLKYSQRQNGTNYHTWEIVLFDGNDPAWLQDHEDELLYFIHVQLGYPHVKEITVR
ncbi:MAG: DEAD/DEAH box helicase family protein, partial [Thermoguttaceae bacterium]